MAYYRPDQRAQGQYLGQPSYPVQQQYFHAGQQPVFSGQQQYSAPDQQQYSAPEQQQYFAPGQQQPNASGQQQYFASEQQQYFASEQQQYFASEQQQYFAPMQQQPNASGQQQYFASEQQEYFNSAQNEQNASEQQAQDPPVQEEHLQTIFEPRQQNEMVFEYDQSLLSYDPQDVDSMFSTSSMFYDLSQAEQNIDASAGNFGEGGSSPEVDIQDAQAAAWAESVQQDDSSHSAADAQLLYQEGIGLEWPAPQGHLEQEVLHTDPLPESRIPETNPEASITAFDRDVDNEHPSNASSPMHRDPDQTYNPGYPHQDETSPEQPLGYRNDVAPRDLEQAFTPRPLHLSGLSPLLSTATTASASPSTVATDLNRPAYCNLLLPNGTRCGKRYSGKEKDAKRNLRRHQLSHVHNGATFPCEAPDCTKGPYTRKEFREKHYELRHPDLATSAQRAQRRSTARPQRLDASGPVM